jgi:predicted amidohydrolase YtcJ
MVSQTLPHPLLLHNGIIYTLDQNQPTVPAVLIGNGRILATGSLEELEKLGIPRPDSLDLHGRTVLPGLIDAHIHLEHYAFALQKVDCEVPSLDECLKRVRARAQLTQPGNWILGHGWNQNEWAEGYPTAGDLDQISHQQPIYLTAKSLHAGWANSAALQLAGITRDTQDPPGGRIQRNSDGEPSGILFESAMQLINNSLPQPTAEEAAQAIQLAQSHLWAYGITGAHDFDRSRCFSALQILREKGLLRLRVTKSIPMEHLDEAVELGLRSSFGDEWLSIGSVKLFADGALGPRTAAMLQPYAGEPENTGILLIDQEELFEYGRRASEHGISMAIHAIGDRAIHEVLNAYQQLRIYEREQNISRRRHRIEHVQVIHPQDTARLAKYGIIASMQPIHAISDMDMADRYWGPRAAGAYAWKSQLEAGARLVFGSDAPVDSPNPFWGLHAAVTRQKLGRQAAWYSEQSVGIADALHAYTTGPAYAAGHEQIQGKLLPGFYADLIVLDQDPFKINPEDLHKLLPIKTMVGGEWVWES